MDAASAAKIFGASIDSIYFNISINLKMIEEIDLMIASLMEHIHSLVKEHRSEKFIKQVQFLESITGVGFLSAITIMCDLRNIVWAFHLS